VNISIDHVQTLPVYCLELEGNPKVSVETVIYRPDAAAVWITDTESGEKFGVRFNDLEAVTRLCIHADSLPTIGNWEPT
jgi:trimethylamine:corrinoid methyltransferase-like protein